MPKQLFCGDEEAGLFLFWCIFVVLLAGESSVNICNTC